MKVRVLRIHLLLGLLWYIKNTISHTENEFFGAFDDKTLFTLSFHMLHPITEYLKTLENVRYLGTPALEHLKYIVVSYLVMTFPKMGIMFVEAEQTMSYSWDSHQWKSTQASQKRAARKKHDTFWIRLAGFENYFYPTVDHSTSDVKIAFEE